MKCPFCGNENADDLNTCAYCGGPLVEAAAASTPDTLPQKSTPQTETLSESTTLEEQSPPQPEIVENEVLPTTTQPTYPVDSNPIEPSQSTQPPRRGYRKYIWWLVGCFVVVCLLISCSALVWGYKSLGSAFNILQPSTAVPTRLPLSTNPSAPLPTSTHIPSPTPAPTQVPPPGITRTPNAILETPGVLFFDDFSDPFSGWDRVETSDRVTDYYEGAYRIVVNNMMSDSWSNPDELTFGDVSVEVDAVKNDGPDDNDFGLICRYQDGQHFYYAVISSDGYYGLYKMDEAGSGILGRDNMESSNQINLGAATNHIRLDCVGDVLNLYVNGEMLDQQTDAVYSSGNVGIIAGTYNTAGTDILFDNFIVVQP